jgi:hypothetical protein
MKKLCSSLIALGSGLLAACAGDISSPGAPATGAAAPGAVAPLPPVAQCQASRVARAPLRRLTRFEYDNTVRDLLGDATSPASALPPEDLGNGFGNDASAQSVSSLLAEQYGTVARGIAARATSPAAIGKLAPCAATVSAATEESCARTIIEGLAPRAFRRPLAAGESDGLLALYHATRAGGGFGSAVGAVIEALLQSPQFLYRVELGVPDRARPELRRPSGDEMATRLSYFLWGSMPDEALRAAARSGELLTAPGVMDQARRMLDDPRSHQVVRFFFANLLPISGLSDLERDPQLYPSYTPDIVALMAEETQRLLENEVFRGGGSWPSALTAPYTFVNGALAKYYGLPGVSGPDFQKVPVDTTRRLGFITNASVLAGTTPSDHTNPVLRGSFVVQKLLCHKVPLPDPSIADMIKPPEPYSGKTARERYAKHSQDPVCSGCHSLMDPAGLALENFDAIGLYRTEENGVTIDPTGTVPGLDGKIGGPVDLIQKLAASSDAQDCFATHWLELAFGKTLGRDDQCLQATVQAAFKQAKYDVRQLLIALTQTDAFLSLGGP